MSIKILGPPLETELLESSFGIVLHIGIEHFVFKQQPERIHSLPFPHVHDEIDERDLDKG